MARLLRSRSVVAATVAAAVVVVAVALTAAGAATAPDLAPVPADRLIASSLAALADPSLSVSGTVHTHVDVGVPQLPATTAGPTGPLSLLLSDQTLKVWRSSNGLRIAQILPAAERDLVVTPSDVWFWDSDRFAAWHAAPPGTATPQTPPSLGDVEGIVSQVLARIEPYAAVATASPVEVAGRPAYVVRVTPASPSDTLVDRIEVAIDARTRVPLRLEVFADGVAASVVRIEYTDVSFERVDPSVFDFTPPDGAVVHEIGNAADAERSSWSVSGMFGGVSDVRSFRNGFGLIVAVRVAKLPPELAPFLPYRGPIASADAVDRGDHAWIVAGLVPPDALASVERKLT